MKYQVTAIRDADGKLFNAQVSYVTEAVALMKALDLTQDYRPTMTTLDLDSGLIVRAWSDGREWIP